jgi:membrane protein YqaA with SNARE-associated domain
MQSAIESQTLAGAAAPTIPAGRRAGWRRGAVVLGTLALVIGAFAVMAWLTSDPSRRAAVAGLVSSPFGLLVLFGLAALSTATLILPAPGLALTAIAGSAGDPIVVGVVAGLGQAVGELTGYAAGWSGRSLLPNNPATARLSGWLSRRGVIVVFVLAVVPNPLFDVAGILAGAMRMPIGHYLAAAALGKIVKNVIIAGGAATLSGLLAAVGG